MKIRVKFTKHGAMRYIGHLDLQRYFQRVNRRAGLKVVYSEGFSPHQKMSFAMPLSVGYESDGEYFDLELYECPGSERMISLLNEQQTEGISVLSCVLLPEKAENAMASVRAADYIITFREGYEAPFDIFKAAEDIKDSSSFVIKKAVKKKGRRRKITPASYNTRSMADGTEKSVREIGRENSSEAAEYKEEDIRPYIFDIRSDGGRIFLKVSAGSQNNIKPELVIASLYEKEGFELPAHVLKITRGELYTFDADGKNLIPLYAAGEVF